MDENKSQTQKQSKKEMFAELDRLKHEIISLRKDLNSFGTRKESGFAEKEDFSKEIKEKISTIKENKEKRDSFTKEVKELKEKRTKLNDKIRHKISEFRKLDEEKKKILSKLKIKDPAALKKDIENIEKKLETEVMSFDKEKQLSKKLRDMKKSLLESGDAIKITESLRKLNKEITESKKETENIHKQIQEKAKKSQELHELIIRTSKEVDGLKPKEHESYKKSIGLKKEFGRINHELKEKLTEMSGIREKINKFTLEEEEKNRLRETMLIQSKEKEIEEKLKSKKKLTTEDFLVFQDIIKKK